MRANNQQQITRITQCFYYKNRCNFGTVIEQNNNCIECSLYICFTSSIDEQALLDPLYLPARPKYIIFTHLKLWIAVARHSFKWVKI